MTDKKRHGSDAGVRFDLIPKDEPWVINEKVVAERLPRKDYPDAWRISKTGGNVKTEIDPYPED